MLARGASTLRQEGANPLTPVTGQGPVSLTALPLFSCRGHDVLNVLLLSGQR